MARKASVENNNKRKRLAKSYAAKRKALKEKIYDKNLSLSERFECAQKLSNLPRNSAKNRIRNRCELTGRPRAYYRKFGLSRNMLRKLAGSGLLPGVIKASW